MFVFMHEMDMHMYGMLFGSWPSWKEVINVFPWTCVILLFFFN